MSGVQVNDELTLRVPLKRPFSQFPLTLGYTTFYLLPVTSDAGRKAFGQAPIGNGPFRMDGTWEHDQRIGVTEYACRTKRDRRPHHLQGTSTAPAPTTSARPSRNSSPPTTVRVDVGHVAYLSQAGAATIVAWQAAAYGHLDLSG